MVAGVPTHELCHAAGDPCSPAQPNGTMQQDGAPVVGPCHLFCRIVDPLQEPAGLWFESCGGWHGRKPTTTCDATEAKASQPTTWVQPHKQGQQAPPAAAQHVGSRGAVLYILESDDDGSADTAAAKAKAELALGLPNEAAHAGLPAGTSWHIPGHEWVKKGDIASKPPLRPGDLLVLSTVIPREYAPAYQRVTETYARRMQEDPKSFPVVAALLCGNIHTSLSRRIEAFIKK